MALDRKYWELPWDVPSWLTSPTRRKLSIGAIGLFRELLDHQWLEGSIPDDIDEIAVIVGKPRSVLEPLWGEVRMLFKRVSGRRNAQRMNIQLQMVRKSKTSRKQQRRGTGRESGEPSPNIATDKPIPANEARPPGKIGSDNNAGANEEQVTKNEEQVTRESPPNPPLAVPIRPPEPERPPGCVATTLRSLMNRWTELGGGCTAGLNRLSTGLISRPDVHGDSTALDVLEAMLKSTPAAVLYMTRKGKRPDLLWFISDWSPETVYPAEANDDERQRALEARR